MVEEGNMNQKTTYHHGNLRAALLEAAFALLVESGAEGLSLRSVAKRAGVSPGAPYHHFKDKQTILTELADDRRQRAVTVFVESMANEATPRAKLRALGNAYVRYALEHQAEHNLMFGGSLQAHVPNGEPGEIPILKLFKTLIHEVDDQLGPDELNTAGIAVWSQVHGLAELLMSSPLKELRDDPVRVAALTEQVALVIDYYATRALRNREAARRCRG